MACCGIWEARSGLLITACFVCCHVILQGKRCLVSGSGNVAQYAAEKLLQLGATVLTLSDSTGYLYEPNGFTMEQIQQVRHVLRILVSRRSGTFGLNQTVNCLA